MLLLRLGGLRFPLLGGLLVGSIRLYDRVEVVDKRDRERERDWSRQYGSGSGSRSRTGSSWIVSFRNETGRNRLLSPYEGGGWDYRRWIRRRIEEEEDGEKEEGGCLSILPTCLLTYLFTHLSLGVYLLSGRSFSHSSSSSSLSSLSRYFLLYFVCCLIVQKFSDSSI